MLDEPAPLVLPASGTITVAVLLSPRAELVDFAGPWGVFEYSAWCQEQFQAAPDQFTGTSH